MLYSHNNFTFCNAKFIKSVKYYNYIYLLK